MHRSIQAGGRVIEYELIQTARELGLPLGD